MTEPAAPLRGIPQVDALIGRAVAEPALRKIPRSIVRDVVREIVGEVRERWRGGRGPAGDYFLREDFLADVEERVARRLRRRHEPVVNATGILLHTGLGRAPLSDAAIDAAAAAGRYAIVEVDPDRGDRDLREVRCAELVAELTGAESATVVNNNAAATMLILATLAPRRDVLVSRGELVEIGGGFRMPDVMAAAGCRLVEVGTTNRTYVKDYASAIGETTGLLLKVHTSNFRVLGFTHSPAIGELADLAATRGVPLVYDLGSGLLRHFDVEPLTNEPTVSDAIAAGADVVCFSGDKLLCGPQSGILAGKKRYIDRIRENPLFRALRPGKLDLAALEATLLAYRIDDGGSDELPDLPLYRQLALSCDELRRRAERIRGALAHLPVRLEIRKTIGFLGSGSAPAREIESVALSIVAPDLSAAQLADRLRRGTPRVFARIADSEVLVEMRSVFEDQVEALIASLTGALAAHA